MERKLRLSIRGALSFGILFIIVLWLWWFFRSYLLLAALVVMTGCVCASAAVLWYGREGLRIEAVMPEGRVGRGSVFPLDIRIANPVRLVGFTADIRYRWGNVFTANFQSQKECLWIAPGRGADRQQLMESRYAGRLEVQIENFRVYDLFHVFCLEGCERRDAWVVAYPRPMLGGDEEIYSCVEGFPKENESKRKGTDYNPDYEIREYIPGDELKSIHWKLTAKRDRLMVRERLATGREKINVVLPLGEEKEQNDRLMDSLYDLCLLLLAKEYPIQLYWPGGEDGLRARFLAEQGELENVICEILSSCGLHLPGSVQEQMAIEHPGEKYILIQTGAYKGAYIQ